VNRVGFTGAQLLELIADRALDLGNRKHILGLEPSRRAVQMAEGRHGDAMVPASIRKENYISHRTGACGSTPPTSVTTSVSGHTSGQRSRTQSSAASASALAEASWPAAASPSSAAASAMPPRRPASSGSAASDDSCPDAEGQRCRWPSSQPASGQRLGQGRCHVGVLASASHKRVQSMMKACSNCALHCT